MNNPTNATALFASVLATAEDYARANQQLRAVGIAQPPVATGEGIRDIVAKMVRDFQTQETTAGRPLAHTGVMNAETQLALLRRLDAQRGDGKTPNADGFLASVAAAGPITIPVDRMSPAELASVLTTLRSREGILKLQTQTSRGTTNEYAVAQATAQNQDQIQQVLSAQRVTAGLNPDGTPKSSSFFRQALVVVGLTSPAWLTWFLLRRGE